MEKEVYLAHTVLKAGNPRPVRSISAASGEQRGSRGETRSERESDFFFFLFFFNLCRSYLESLKTTSLFSEGMHTEA